ncbi:MAG: Uma2 family endonuclease [Phormidesmis sp.]
MIAIPSGFSSEEYLALERKNAVRHEYRRGLVYAMAGGSDDHSSLTINFLTVLNLHLRGSECRVFSGDVKVNYAETFYYYPDAFVTCDPRDHKDRYVKRHPKLIVEVLSPSTESFDQADKFADYKSLGSLQEYVLVSQNAIQVECRRAKENSQGEWQIEIYRKGEQIALNSVGLLLPIEELYVGIEIAET